MTRCRSKNGNPQCGLAYVFLMFLIHIIYSLPNLDTVLQQLPLAIVLLDGLGPNV